MSTRKVGDMTTARPDVAVIGGSGLYALLDDVDEMALDTPYGAPSDPITIVRPTTMAGAT